MVQMLEKSWLTVNETADLVGCSAQRIRFMAKNAEIKAELVNGRCWLIDRTAAETMAKTPAKTGRPRKQGKRL
jgi:excisionase family DNA binding protein